MTETPRTDDAPRRLYISRAGTGRRRVTNEAEVVKYLGRFGFQPVQLESFTLREQARLFSTAEVIAGPHGAGLSNLAFCRPGTRVLEFFGARYVNVCYWALSNQMNLDYYYAIGSPRLRHDDMYLDVEKLSSLLEHAGIR